MNGDFSALRARPIAVVLRAEWRLALRHRALVVSLILPPLALTLLPVIALYAIGFMKDTSPLASLGPLAGNAAFTGLTAREFAQAVTGQQFGLLMLILPMVIPSVLAAQSIVGERAQRTLEPLLATPITTAELLVAKCLAALVPGVLLSWLCAALFAAGVWATAQSSAVVEAVLTPGLYLVLAVCSPLLALFSIGCMVLASSRVTDPRTAQQLSGLLVLPIAGGIVAQVTGALVLDAGLALLTAAVVLVLDALVLVLAVRLFHREAILTRWR